jgi:predicted double-glycine peptidase
MKTSLFILIIVSLMCNSAFADRILSAGEISVILNTLTQQPVGTWLPAGSISARRLEYSMTEKSICEYRETAHFDGLRFYRGITLISGENETESDVQAVKPNSLEMDRERIFCWDGVTYTQYYKSAATAVIQSGQDPVSFGTYGAFSAGIIPWGYGIYTVQNLSACVSSAHEVLVGEQKQIHLQITKGNSSPVLQMNFILDPDKNYAVISYRIEDPQLSGINQSYRQFVQINNRWIPTIITIERFLKKPVGNQVVSYEDWTFEAIKPDVPQDALFSVKLKNDTLVELHSSNYPKSIMYYVNDQKDVKSLLEEKIAFSNQIDSVGKNCAAAVVQLVTKQFSRPYPAGQIEAIIAQNSKMTSLYLLKSKLEETGLYCAAVETNLESLRKLNNVQVILHLEDSSHYVILDRIDDTYVWTIDLTSRKIYWKSPIQEFLQQWKRGIAIIVSDNPQSLNPEGTSLSVSDQQQIMGGNPGYSCTEMIQITDRSLCPEPQGLLCGGLYYVYYQRYGCKEDPNAVESCQGYRMPGHKYARCTTDICEPGSCKLTGDWYVRDIRACQ